MSQQPLEWYFVALEVLRTSLDCYFLNFDHIFKTRAHLESENHLIPLLKIFLFLTNRPNIK